MIVSRTQDICCWENYAFLCSAVFYFLKIMVASACFPNRWVRHKIAIAIHRATNGEAGSEWEQVVPVGIIVHW
ncbi:hypothetical protein LL912_07070 [Niabella sp. CC-SYL272]|uniref:hypothetical protein n=1 Tax=Niabella agricola TaxID=2891571 RepID=UPI001F16DB7D|nr:hypothetical protein [Niabella agricola]MCF3108534.1 hypothetical protein [Niabella agricola]